MRHAVCQRQLSFLLCIMVRIMVSDKDRVSGRVKVRNRVRFRIYKIV